jgi:hypothetical protein
MATGVYPTLVDVLNAMDPDGSIAAVAEVLSQTNEVLQDMPFFEGNLPTGHRSVVRTGLGTAVWRKLYGGVPASKGTRTPVVDACGMLEARNEIDKDEAELNGNTAAFRLDEASVQVETMNQGMATALFYGDTTVNPEQFHGLAPRYNTLPTALVPISQNVLSGSGAGADNTSVWFIVWGKQTVFGAFPKGSKGGLIHQDLGEIDAFDSNGDRYRAYSDRWQWKNTVVVKDWRYAVRICNIDTSDLVAENVAAADLIKLMIKAKHRIPFLTMGRPVIYCNRTVREMLDIQALSKSTNALSIREAAGQFSTNFLGIPIKTCDAITNAETVVA